MNSQNIQIWNLSELAEIYSRTQRDPESSDFIRKIIEKDESYIVSKLEDYGLKIFRISYNQYLIN